MRSPWLDIPLEDYEAHMALPSVGQAQLLAELLGEALERHQPRSVAVLGCAGGNGLEHIPSGAVERVVGIDINPEYIARARARFAGRVPGLELFVGDVQTDRFPFEPVDLAFAGLLFEYVDVATTLARIRPMLRSGGVLVAVLQLPSDTGEVTPSPYRSLTSLSPVLSLVPPRRFQELAAVAGFRALDPAARDATGGKRFHVQGFKAVRREIP